jgi:hypothetical protein
VKGKRMDRKDKETPGLHVCTMGKKPLDVESFQNGNCWYTPRQFS